MKITRIAYYVTALVVAVWSFHTSANCDAALILLSGARISSSSIPNMKKLFGEIKNEYSETMYIDTNLFDIDGGTEILEEISKEFPHHSEFVVVGHSLGGDYAYALSHSLNVNLLVTLDPVSRRALQKNKPRPEGARKWINVYIGWREKNI